MTDYWGVEAPGRSFLHVYGVWGRTEVKAIVRAMELGRRRGWTRLEIWESFEYGRYPKRAWWDRRREFDVILVGVAPDAGTPRHLRWATGSPMGLGEEDA